MGKHVEWRKKAKKQRRKRIRQNLARQRNKLESLDEEKRLQSPTYQQRLQEEHELEEFVREEEERFRSEREIEWLQAEEEAQKRFEETKVKLQQIELERQKQIALIQSEWEEKQKTLQKLKELKEKELEQKLLEQRAFDEQIEKYIENGGDTPEHLQIIRETNSNRPSCPFFEKTGSCRFGDTCSRNHVKVTISKTVLIRNFYTHYNLKHNDYEYDGADSCLEYENSEIFKDFKEFFFDVVPEMEKCGRVRLFRTCCNRETHLRGNVYCEFSTKREALKCYRLMNGRWYGGRLLNVEFCRIASWRAAICRLFFKQRCPKGSACNFLHVFRNPRGIYEWIDEEYIIRQRHDSERRNWRWSESPERLIVEKNTRQHNDKHKKTTRRVSKRHRHKSVRIK